MSPNIPLSLLAVLIVSPSLPLISDVIDEDEDAWLFPSRFLFVLCGVSFFPFLRFLVSLVPGFSGHCITKGGTPTTKSSSSDPVSDIDDK